jgi:MATE family multidrug resistance protein
VVFLWSGVVGLINIAIYAVAGHAIIELMTSIPEVRAAAVSYLWWPVLMPLASVWAYTYDGVYLAATRTRIMRNTVIASFAIFLTLIYTLLPLIGNAGLWFAVGGFLVGRGVLLHLFFPRVLRTIGIRNSRVGPTQSL